MEEVAGSIPARSTKSLNNLERAGSRSAADCQGKLHAIRAADWGCYPGRLETPSYSRRLQEDVVVTLLRLPEDAVWRCPIWSRCASPHAPRASRTQSL